MIKIANIVAILIIPLIASIHDGGEPGSPRASTGRRWQARGHGGNAAGPASDSAHEAKQPEPPCGPRWAERFRGDGRSPAIDSRRAE